MIKYLIGEITEKNLDDVVIETNNIGYGVQVTVSDFGLLAVGEKTKLHIYENVKEDRYELFGFKEKSSLELFEQLLSVKNVGPKVALAIFGIGSGETVREAIAGGDVKKLQSAKGVGKRAAEQIVVELRDKVGLLTSSDAEDVVTRGSVDQNDEALQALVALGFSEYDAQKALASTDKNIPTEDRIKQALKDKK